MGVCGGGGGGFAGTLLGPLHTKSAIKEYTEGLEEIQKQGGKILFGGSPIEGPGNYVQPTIVEIDPSAPIVKTELFVPILYVPAAALYCLVPAGHSLRVCPWRVRDVAFGAGFLEAVSSRLVWTCAPFACRHARAPPPLCSWPCKLCWTRPLPLPLPLPPSATS